MFTLFKKELNYYLNNPIGYIIMILFAAFANFFYMKDIFVVGSASMQPFFSFLPWILLIFVPAITMRTLAEERRANTIETLLTLPISETQIVLSKFLALLTVVAIGLMLTLSIPVTLVILAKVSMLEIVIAYIGTLLLAGFFVSVSMLFSSLTKNQVIAFLSSILVLFLILVISTDFVAAILPKSVQSSLQYFGPFYHLQNFTKGLIDLRSLFYFVSGITLFLFLTKFNLERRD